MPFRYQTGEEIRSGYQVLFHREPGEVDFVADSQKSPHDWYVVTHGGGAMILHSEIGLVFLDDPQGYEDLEFVARQPGTS